MTELRTALHAFWSKAIETGVNPQTGKMEYLLCYPQGGEPINDKGEYPKFPFFTYPTSFYPMQTGETVAGQGIETIYVWSKSGSFSELGTLETAFHKLIPQEGLKLEIEGLGFIKYNRRNPFTDPYAQTDKSIKCTKIGVEISSYIIF